MQVMETIEAVSEKVLSAMSDAGFHVNASVRIVVDENLSFMGYTVGTKDGYTVVVSGKSVKSGFLHGLLTHELSHIYRMESGHVSHDENILTHALNHAALKHRVSEDSKLQMLHQAVNHIQDLYADDISFAVFCNKNPAAVEKTREFFFSWIKDEPVKGRNADEQKWINAAMMLNNTFALSNMDRHGILDEESVRKNETFLSKVGGVSGKFQYFKSLMTGLDESVDEKEFRRLLEDYMDNFIELVK